MNHILSPSLPSLCFCPPQARGLLAESSWSRTKKAGPSLHWSRWRFPMWSGLNRSSTSTTRRRCWLRSTTPFLSDCKFTPVLSHGHTVGEERGVTQGQSIPGHSNVPKLYWIIPKLKDLVSVAFSDSKYILNLLDQHEQGFKCCLCSFYLGFIWLYKAGMALLQRRN